MSYRKTNRVRLIVSLGCCLFILMTTTVVWGTAQIPEQLIYQGKTQALLSEPLESYFNAERKRPSDLLTSTCTACWRGYIATWKIENKVLYLMKMVKGDCGRKDTLIPISEIIKDRRSPVKADWFSGTLRVPQGEVLKYVHAGYATRYEKDLLIEIKNGMVVGEHIRDNRRLNSDEQVGSQ